MNDTEKILKKLSEIAERSNQNESKFRIDWNMLIQGLMFAGIVYIASAFNTGNNNDIMQSRDIEQIKVDMTELKDQFKVFGEKPRYTQENANTDLLPLKNTINSHTLEIEAQSDFLAKLQTKQTQHDLRLTLLESKGKNTP